jgi:ubiquitin-conjugating enzyme E2 A
MDTIQDRWSPCHSVASVLASVQSLLTDPNCASPANPEAARLYLEARREYDRRVRRAAQRSVEG